MNNYHKSTELAIIALCTKLGNLESNINPLTSIQYNLLATKLYNSSLKSPGALLENIEIFDSYLDELQLPFQIKEKVEQLLLPERVTRTYIALQDLSRRNINVLTRSSINYPLKLKKKLKNNRPPVLFYIGNLELLNENIVGIVGSRNINSNEENFIKENTINLLNQSFTIITGGANGSDKIAEQTTLDNNGNLILFLSAGMNKKITEPPVIKHLIDDKMLILSESLPNESFKVYTAMQRNKYIYSLSKYVIIARTDYNKGGTWAGATEALKHKYCDVYLKSNDSEGFKALINLGAKVYNNPDNNINELEETVEQLSLFDNNTLINQ